MNHSTQASPAAPRLGLWDAASIIVGIVVGTAIFKSPVMVFRGVGLPAEALGAWLLGGVLSLCGALCYAELAATYPRDGGDYEYLSRALGRWLGFLFGWAQLSVVISGNIGIMAYAFADYATRLWPALAGHAPWLAVAAVLALAICNLFGVGAGKLVQNGLTGVKLAGLTVVVVAGAWVATWGAPVASELPAGTAAPAIPPLHGFGLAMVFVLYAYGGWNHAAYVAAEVRQPQRNLPRALLLGLAAITIIYLAVNAAYLAALGLDGARQSAAPAADVLRLAAGATGEAGVSLLVMVSALGAINGMILTSPRIYAEWGTDFPAFGWLAKRGRRTGVPVGAVLAQAAVAIGLILLVGTATGQRLFDGALALVGIGGLPWQEFFGGFETLVAGSAPVFWTFFLATGISLMVLRHKDGARNRPFRVPLYPLPPLVFCATCLFMLWSSVEYAGWLTLVGLVPLGLAAPLYLVARRSLPARH